MDAGTQERSRRRSLAIGAIASLSLFGSALTLGTSSSGAGAQDAQSAVGAVRPPATAVDADGDRVGDDLEALVLAAAPTDRFDVIVRSTLPAPVDTTPLPLIGGYATSLTAGQVLSLAIDPATVRIDLDGVVHLTDDGGLSDHGVARAQTDFGVDGTGVGICVIDSGVDPNHEQLDDGKVVGWIDLINGLPIPYDDHGTTTGGHGTHVASIAAGDGIGGPQAATYRGAAPGASLYVAKAFEGTVPDDIPVSPTAGQESVTIQGIQWCVDQPGVDIISMSFTKTGPSDGTDALGTAVEAAVAAGKVAVAAAGNDGPNPGLLGSPGAAASAITVGAVADWSLPISAANRSEGPFLPAFSSRGPTADGRIKPDVVAPGHSVLAARSNTGATYSEKSGTSMATPSVAGTLALALERNPALTHADLATLVEATAIDRGPTGKDIDWGAGMLDGFGLVSRADGTAIHEPTTFPRHEVLTGTTVGGPWETTFELTTADLDVPIAATIIIDGAPAGTFWTPDLQAELYGPGDVLLDTSDCPFVSAPATDDCLGNTTNAGRQELVHALPLPGMPGTYRLVVSDSESILSSGGSGSFLVDLSYGVPDTAPLPGPCTILWTGDGDGSTWTDPANWSTGLVPLPSDVVCIPAGATVSHDPLVTMIRGLVVDGVLDLAPATQLRVTDAAVATVIAGTVALGPVSSLTAAATVEVVGLLTGTGTVESDVTNRGEVRPGAAGPGTLTITGDYVQTLAGVLAVDASTPSSPSDLLVVQGDATLDGTVDITTAGSVSVGDDVEIIDVGGSRTGDFVQVVGATIDPDHHWFVDLTRDAPDVHLVVVAGPPPPPGHVTICHRPDKKKPKTMSLPAQAAQAHIRSHGDTAGPCPV